MNLSRWIWTWALAGQCFVAAGGVPLVEEGTPKAVIVVAADAGDVARSAAEALQSYLERMSGARLEIRTEQDAVTGPRVLVGPSAAVTALGVEVPSGFTSRMNEEGFLVRTVDSDLVLAGNDHAPYRGTLFAVYDFLEHQGCRWFFPGAFGEVVPSHKTIVVGEVDRVERPDFRFRNIWYSGWMPVREEDSRNLAAWLDHNKMTSLSSLSLPGDGSITRLAPAEQFFDSHPEIYAIDEKGARMRDMLCLSEPEAVRIAVQTITNEFRAHPDMMSFGFAPPDGHPQCHCPRCQAAIPGFSGKGFGDPSLSDIWFKFANAVATEVYKEFPDRWLFTNGYANRVRPPEGVGKLSPNLGIQSAMLDTCTLHSIGDPKCWPRQVYQGVLDRWTRELNCVFIYDYDPGKSLDNLPFPMLHNLARDFPYFKQRNVWGFWTEGQNCWMVTHLNYYVRAKLMWDADADVRTLVRDYCEEFYGSAAEAIEEYIWTLEDAIDQTQVHSNWGRLLPWTAMLTPDLLRRLDALVRQAQSQADQWTSALAVPGVPVETWPDIEAKQDRLRVFAWVHDHMTAFLEMERAAGRGDFARAVAWADKAQGLRDDVAKVDAALLPHTPEWCRESNGSIEWYRKTYQSLANQAGGPEGELIALLPATWEFKTDPEELGVIYQWYLPESGQPWAPIDGTLYWDIQGRQDAHGWPYTGKAWYRASVFVPESAKEKPLRLTFGGIYSTGLWVWINGQLADHRPRQDTRTPFSIDVAGHIRPGEMNTVAVLVNTITADRSPRGGIYRRAFLWSPRPKEEGASSN